MANSIKYKCLQCGKTFLDDAEFKGGFFVQFCNEECLELYCESNEVLVNFKAEPEQQMAPGLEKVEE